MWTPTLQGKAQVVAWTRSGCTVDNKTRRMSFEPGQSGNPLGRPRGSRNKRSCRLGDLFFRCDFFLPVRNVCFLPFHENEESFDLLSFRLDGVVGCCSSFRFGSNFEASVVIRNPATGSCLIGFLLSRSIAANFLCS